MVSGQELLQPALVRDILNPFVNVAFMVMRAYAQVYEAFKVPAQMMLIVKFDSLCSLVDLPSGLHLFSSVNARRTLSFFVFLFWTSFGSLVTIHGRFR